ncbi:hypothetical protein ACXYX3_12675 [Mycobacterium sp. C3-094]|uniref:hypothetical protein n=1 Tax=Mycobacterium sp. PSTR-4-N TaxID=2917745 RepID=UPI001F150CAD|nr:hypothetical protein [Mycobacterium sp. PSTR-4-N]MCG7597676.1 hypothetical protein [Mycobacterium sp. PSTR-4-N]
MPSPSPTPDELRVNFQILLNSALTHGRAAARDCGLGPATIAAINAIAYDHPDAEADTVAAAYDAFSSEHGAQATSMPA